MKNIFCFFILLISASPLYSTINTKRDSLLNIINNTKDLEIKAYTYRNLADLYFEKPEEQVYLKKSYHIAKQAGDKKMTLSLLSDLSNAFIKNQNFDSAHYYMQDIEKEAGFPKANAYLAYLRIRIFDKKIRGEKEVAEQAIKEELELFKHADKSNIYIQIEQAYVTGSSILENKKFKDAIPYLETAYKLTENLPSEDRYKYIVLTGWVYGGVFKFINNKPKTLSFVEMILNEHRKFYTEYTAKQRPFFPIHLFYLQCYASLIMHIDILPKTKSEYYINEIKKLAPKVTDPVDKYSCFLALGNYSSFMKDYNNALLFNDSLMKYAKILAPAILPNLYRTHSKIYELKYDYKNSLAFHKLYTATKDSLSSKQAEEQISRMQVQYDVDKLNYEKTRLENKNKQILLVTLGIILLATSAGCTYLYYSLKKERRMKKRLHELNEKAEESEKLKTAFLNSMCHEIRTPLNAIVGFSGIIVDESIDCDTKNEFYNEITTNTNLLTSLIDHLLVVANLDSSDEKLPCESTDIKAICHQELEKAQREGKSTISYHLDMPEEELFANSNHRYLSLVIENLLNNANKFTSQGDITLKVSLEKGQQILQISVTDTGCGIPMEKQEIVFDRFTKLDSFTQGNGLGLYLCQLIIRRLSGEIYIDSNYTAGSKFIITLPI